MATWPVRQEAGQQCGRGPKYLGVNCRSDMATEGIRTTTAREQDPTRGRWWLVAAALLLQFSIGAVYAWSVFSKALGVAEPSSSARCRARCRSRWRSA